MEPNNSQLFQLLGNLNRQFSERETGILNLWANATTLDTQETAAEVSRRIDELCPSLGDNKQVQDFVWMLWDMMLLIARSPYVTSEIQERLIKVILELQKIDKGTVFIEGDGSQGLWKDTPSLGMALETHRTDPTIIEEEPLTVHSAQGWLKFNEFEARLLKAGSIGAYLDAALVLQSALEEELPIAAEDGVADCRVMAASIWLSRCAKNFFDWAQENANPEVAPDKESYLEAGLLYNGKPYICPKRWEFWQHRLEELKAPDSGLLPHVREAVQKAYEAMRTVGAGVGSSEASWVVITE